MELPKLDAPPSFGCPYAGAATNCGIRISYGSRLRKSLPFARRHFAPKHTCGEEVALLLLDKRPQSSSLIVGWKVAQIRYRYRHRYRWSVSVSVVHHVLNVLLQSEVDLSTTYTNEAAVGSSITRDQQLRLVLQIIETPDSSSGVS
jgi:hypothetical protein